LAGDWSGTLPNVPPKQVIVHVRRTDQGMKLTMDVPALGVQGIPIDQFGREGSRIHFAMPTAGVAFEGELQLDGREIRGTFTDHDIVQPLVLDYSASDAPPPPLKVAAAQAGWQTPSADQIREVLKSEIEARQTIGLIVGVVGPGGRIVVSQGAGDLTTGAPIAADTPLYLESVVKALTGLLLADMAGRGEVKLDDPVDLYLPAGEHMPEHDGRKITLADLATQTSGFPRGEDGVSFEDTIRKSPGQLRTFLEGFQLTRDPGSAYQYSDIGSALLGDALARRAGASFEQLVRSRVMGRYGLSDTVTQPTAALTARMPMLYDSGLQPRGKGPAFTDAWIPAFGFYSTVDDMLKLLEVQLRYRPDPLAAASARARDVRRPVGPGGEQSLAWEVRRFGPPGAEVYGVVGGSRSMATYVAFRPDTRTGVVVYANAPLNVSDIAYWVLTGRPIPPPASPPASGTQTAIHVPAGTLAGYVGRYRLNPQMVITMTADGERLFGAVNSNPRTELFAATPTHFFARTANAQVDFQTGPDGRATALTLRLNGVTMTAARNTQ
jgi:CubicO group peptidase (beta-lactamase class C family)